MFFISELVGTLSNLLYFENVYCTKPANQLSIHLSGYKESGSRWLTRQAEPVPLHPADSARGAVPAHAPGQCQPARGTKPAADSWAPLQPFSSPCSWIPDIRPDSSLILLRSQSETRANGKVGHSFWPGSPSYCSPRPPLHHQRTQQLALPQVFQTAKIPMQTMFLRWRLFMHPLGDTGEFSTDSINHLSAMWSYYFSYSPFDTLHFPEESAPMLPKLAHPTVNTGHLQRILLRPWSLWWKSYRNTKYWYKTDKLNCL